MADLEQSVDVPTGDLTFSGTDPVNVPSSDETSAPTNFDGVTGLIGPGETTASSECFASKQSEPIEVDAALTGGRAEESSGMPSEVREPIQESVEQVEQAAVPIVDQEVPGSGSGASGARSGATDDSNPPGNGANAEPVDTSHPSESDANAASAVMSADPKTTETNEVSGPTLSDDAASSSTTVVVDAVEPPTESLPDSRSTKDTPEPMETSSSEAAPNEDAVMVGAKSNTIDPPVEENNVAGKEKPHEDIEVRTSSRPTRRAALKAESNIRAYARGEEPVDLDDNFDAQPGYSSSSEPRFDGKTCPSCRNPLASREKTLFWEAMEFCDAKCLERTQKEIGSNCVKCKKSVERQFLGKYCVRFGATIRQFCTNVCLESFKRALRVCAYCQLDISEVANPITAHVGEKQILKDFCSPVCKAKFHAGNALLPDKPEICAVCSQAKPVQFEAYLSDSSSHSLCSDPCLSAFKFAKNCNLEKCGTCYKLMEKSFPLRVVIAAGRKHDAFCSKTCSNVFVLASRKIVPCSNCKVKKYSFDMIEQPGDAGSVYFCGLICYENFQNKTKVNGGGGLRIASVASLTNPINMPVVSIPYLNPAAVTDPIQKSMLRPPPKQVRNKAIICKPSMVNKGVSTRAVGSGITVDTQTDDSMGRPVIIPVPTPVYVPSPMAMYNAPYPVPIIFPLPIPVPIFIPTTKKTTARIQKEIKKILKKVPADPLEAELLMMAQAVGETRKEVDGDDSDDEEDEDVDDDFDVGGDVSDHDDDPARAAQGSRMSGDDILQTALRSAVSDDGGIGGAFLGGAGIDVEQALAGTAQAVTKSLDPPKRQAYEEPEYEVRKPTPQRQQPQRKRTRSSRGSSRGGGRGGKRGRTEFDKGGNQENQEPPPPPESLPPEERPDANMMLKFTFGVNAWRFWVTQKNQELEKTYEANPKRRKFFFKTDILQMSCEELCFALCFFVKEVKKPDGSQYSPDLVYYLCLGIQEYLLENGRVENIFNDQIFEKFTDSLNEITRQFSGQKMLMEFGYIMTHIEEEHLWEAKQLGAHSPHVLLNTLMYFTTKHFLLTTEKDHVRLSFPHVMKHWKKGPGGGGRGAHQQQPAVGGQRNVLLKYYPPASIRAEMGERAKRNYEMHENSENPLRCPIRLYEFYLSKCPESIKGKNEVFYLFPERSCVPHSPVWYSTQPLSEAVISKMLHRISLVREIQDAIINDQ